MDWLNFYETKIHLMRRSIWYHLNNLKDVKNTHGGVLLLVNLHVWVFFVFLTLFRRCCSRLLDCPNGTKSRMNNTPIQSTQFHPQPILSEAVTQKCSVKKVSLKIPQNSNGNTCASVSFSTKLQACIKKEILAQVFFCEFYKNF